MRALIVEDDAIISQLITQGLAEVGYDTTAAADGQTALDLACSKAFDVLIVDVMLPKLNGLSLVRGLRERGIASPIIILSAKRSIEDRVSGLEAGGDDYLVKPFAFAELLARLQALHRRSAVKNEPMQIALGQIRLDLLSRELLREGKKIELKAKEFLLIEFFLKNPDRVITKSEILERIWGYSFDPQTNVVDVLVCRLRNKVDKDFNEKTIHTVRGRGYVFKPH